MYARGYHTFHCEVVGVLGITHFLPVGNSHRVEQKHTGWWEGEDFVREEAICTLARLIW